MGRNENKNIKYIDNIVCEKIRFFRISKGITRRDLATELKISEQQMFKYEKGINRISAGILCVIADFLKISIFEFYKDVPIYNDIQELRNLSDSHQKMTIQICKNFMQISNEHYRYAINSLVKSLAKNYIQGKNDRISS